MRSAHKPGSMPPKAFNALDARRRRSSKQAPEVSNFLELSPFFALQICSDTGEDHIAPVNKRQESPLRIFLG
jgi:hypothetical protein